MHVPTKGKSMIRYFLISIISCLIPCQIACDWRNCGLVNFTESAVTSASICELISRSVDAASENRQKFTGTWQGAAVQTLAMSMLIGTTSLLRITLGHTPSRNDYIICSGLLSGPLLKTSGCKLWQHIASNISY